MLIIEVAKELEDRNHRGKAFHDAWKNSSGSVIKAAKAHTRYWISDCFVRVVKEKQFSAPVRQILFAAVRVIPNLLDLGVQRRFCSGKTFSLSFLLYFLNLFLFRHLVFWFD